VIGTFRVLFWLAAAVIMTWGVLTLSEQAKDRARRRDRQDDTRAIAAALAAVPWAARADSIDGRIDGRAAQWTVHGTQGDATTRARVFELGRGGLAFGDSLVRPLRIDESLSLGDYGRSERVYYLDHTRPHDADLALVREKSIRARTDPGAIPGSDTLDVEVLFDPAGAIVAGRKTVNGVAAALTSDDVRAIHANHRRVRGMFH